MIPEGYRLLTADDVGKVFGVDLELEVCLDSNEYPSSMFPIGTDAELTNFAEFEWEYDEGFDMDTPNIYVEGNIVFRAGWIFTNAYGSDIYTMSNNTKVETYNTTTDWNTWFYVKDKPNHYNITSSKPKITINCKGKFMTKDLTITRELWDGSYEEIFNGYTLTLNVDEYIADGTYGDVFHYSIDGGSTWVSLNQEQIVLEGITEIKFNFEFSSGMVPVGTTNGGSEITSAAYGETEVFTLDSDATWYITTAPYDFDIQ